MAAGQAGLRTACLIAALAAASLISCQPAPPPEKASDAAAPPPPVPSPKAVPPSTPVALAPSEAPPKPAPKKAPAKKRVAKPKPVPPPVVQAPPPPPPPNPEDERARKRDAYLAAFAKTVVSFNPPSPMQIGQRTSVALTVVPPAETALLGEDLRKSLPDTWSPRLRARLAGADFAVAPTEGKDFDGTKDLAAGRTDWGWSVVAGTPGTKKLVATLSVGLPASLGGPRDLPALARAVEVEPTLAWRAERAWAEYWQWIAGAIVLIAAIGWWLARR
jgi:hypothetical protein